MVQRGRPAPGRARGKSWRPLALVAAVACAGLGAWLLLGEVKPNAATAKAPDGSPVIDLVAAWKAEGIHPAGSADEHVSAGRAALEADLPARTAEAKRHFMQALAKDPGRVDA